MIPKESYGCPVIFITVYNLLVWHVAQIIVVLCGVKGLEWNELRCLVSKRISGPHQQFSTPLVLRCWLSTFWIVDSALTPYQLSSKWLRLGFCIVGLYTLLPPVAKHFSGYNWVRWIQCWLLSQTHTHENF